MGLKEFGLVPALLCLALLAGCSLSVGGKATYPGQPGASASDTVTEAGDREAADSSAEKEARKQLLNEIMQSACQGKVADCEFPVETTVMGDIKEKWGEPDKTDYVPEAKGSYATYAQRGIVFGFNKGDQIFDVRSYDSQLQGITLSSVKEVLGVPDHVNRYHGQDIVGYLAGDKFRLRLVFPQATSESPDPLLDHISVFYPRGTINMMADDPGLEW